MSDGPAAGRRRLAIAEDCTEFRLLRVALGDRALDDWLRGWLAPEADLHPDAYARLLREPAGDWTADPAGLEHADALLVERVAVDEDLLAGASERLKLVVRFGTTPGNVDLGACERRDIEVRYVARPSTSAVAEHTMMLLLVLTRRFTGAGRILGGDRVVAPSVRSTEAGGHPPTVFNWKGVPSTRLLDGMRLAVLGPGEAGRAVLARARAFGMELGYWGRNAAPELERDLGARRLGLEEAARWADVVSVHVEYAPELEHVVDGAFLDALGPEGLLINTARGLLVDFEAVVSALRSGRLGGAGFDVFPEEPYVAPPELLALPNLALTPHLAGGGRLVLIEDVRAILQALDGRSGA